MRWRGSLGRSFLDAGAGIAYALRTQRNIRIHFAATVAAVGLAILLRITTFEWTVILLAIGLVWTAELLNTAIEAVVDLVSPGEHDLARTAKDVSSGAVLIAAGIALGVGVMVFGRPLWALLFE